MMKAVEVIAITIILSTIIHVIYIHIVEERIVARDVFKKGVKYVVDWGGIPIFVSLAASVVVAYLQGLIDNPIPILASLFIAFLVGFIDDLKPGLPGYYKPLASVIPVVPLIYWGIYPSTLRIFDGYVFNIPIIYPFLLTLGFVISLNAVNMLDVINGSAVSGVYIVLFYIVLASAIIGRLPILGILFMAGLAPFLVLNVYPAKIFLGNSGAMLIGSLIPISASLYRVEVTALFAMYPFLVNGLFYLLRFKSFIERRLHGYKVAALGDDGLIHDMCEDGAPIVLLKFLVASRPKHEFRLWIEISILFIVSGLVGLLFVLI